MVYAKGLLQKFGMSCCNAAITPVDPKEKFSLEDGKEEANISIYRSLVEGFIYLRHSRPDLAFSIGLVSKFIEKP